HLTGILTQEEGPMKNKSGVKKILTAKPAVYPWPCPHWLSPPRSKSRWPGDSHPFPSEVPPRPCLREWNQRSYPPLSEKQSCKSPPGHSNFPGIWAEEC